MMNAINPNDLLAKRIIEIAQHNRSGDAFLKAVSAFYKFPEDSILSVHTRILAHQSMTSAANGSRRGSEHSPPRMMGARRGAGERDQVEGMDHEDSDILAAEPRRKGGLMRAGGDAHTFKTPAGARPSLLGLDKLAAEKRAQAAAAAAGTGKSEPPSKRAKTEPEEDEEGNSRAGGVFKGESDWLPLYYDHDLTPRSPCHSRPT